MNVLYTIRGLVEQGNKRGKQLGFPTVNFKTNLEIPEGVYLSRSLVRKKWYNSLTFIGAAKTFDATDYLAETYILDFNTDIYGEPVTVKLFKLLRGNIKFAGAEDLIVQMKKDEQHAREIFANLPPES